MKYFPNRGGFQFLTLAFLSLSVLTIPGACQRPPRTPKPTGPWQNTSLSPDERADLVLKEMTLDEKVALLHGVGMPTDDPVTPENAHPTAA
jgi:beta-glucosidase